MPTKKLALPLYNHSLQQGDITFETLLLNRLDVELTLTNVTSSSNTPSILNFVTSRHGTLASFAVTVKVVDGVAFVSLDPSQLERIKEKAQDGDWDYVRLDWTIESLDTPELSEMRLTQGGQRFGGFKWPAVEK